MNEIKELMERQGINAAELARRTGIKESRLGRILERTTEAKSSEIVAIGAALLLSGEEIDRYFFGIKRRDPQ